MIYSFLSAYSLVLFLILINLVSSGLGQITQSADSEKTQNSFDNAPPRPDFSQEPPCVFECNNGISPRPRRFYEPKPDGCGFGVDIKGYQAQDSKIDFTACCNQHDICYSTCLNDKKQCDLRFDECNRKWCNDNYGTEEKEHEECIRKADMTKTLARLVGCQDFLKAQKEACTCAKQKKKKAPKQEL